MDSPQDIGLPHPSWRPGQRQMVEDIAYSPTRHQILIAPTGFGKSLTYMALAQITGWRIGVLTATKALQDQLAHEFAVLGMVDLRGQSNYTCDASLNPSSELRLFFRKGVHYTARTAPCRKGVRCQLKDGGCAYYDKIREAARSPLWVTNYDFWLHNQGKLGKVDLLVMDEAHQAPDELADHLSFTLTPEDRRALGIAWPDTESTRDWADWAEFAVGQVEDEDRKDELGDLGLTLKRMAEVLGAGEWVIERHHDGPLRGKVTFDCIDSDAFGQKYMWGGVGRVLMVSATVNLMTAAALGMNTKEVKVWEAKSGFSVARRPIYVVDGAPRLNFRSLEGEKRMWVSLADRVIRERADRKGIFHTHSFERAKYVVEHSRSGVTCFLNESRNTQITVTNFKRAATGILVSPSVTTGWDFPGSECEYQVIGKIPFPDLRTKAAKAKNQRNKEWAGYTAAQVIVQASGRGMRSEGDQCETFIIDGNFGWWFNQNKKYLPQWWRDAVQWVGLSALPKPPATLAKAKGGKA